MSGLPNVRRDDKLMPIADVEALLHRAHAGRLALVSPSGYPYCVPLLYVYENGQIWLHNGKGDGHLKTSLGHGAKACFEVDEAGEVFDYGRFECDSSVAYQSVIAFGEVSLVTERAAKERFCDLLMAKYRHNKPERPASFYPRLAAINVYRFTIEQMTGKTNPLPPLDAQWPNLDMTKTPNANPR